MTADRTLLIRHGLESPTLFPQAIPRRRLHSGGYISQSFVGLSLWLEMSGHNDCAAISLTWRCNDGYLGSIDPDLVNLCRSMPLLIRKCPLIFDFVETQKEYHIEIGSHTCDV